MASPLTALRRVDVSKVSESSAGVTVHRDPLSMSSELASKSLGQMSPSFPSIQLIASEAGTILHGVRGPYFGT